MTITTNKCLRSKEQHAYRLLTVFLIVVLGFSTAHAQFQFPATQVLKDSNVKTIKVYRQQLRYVGGPEKERQQMGLPDTTRALYEVYHLNEYGYADSILTYNKYVYTYDGPDIVGYKVIRPDSVIYQQGEIIKLENGEMISRSWEYGHLRSKVRINADGILVEQLFYARSDTTWRSAIRFDPATNMKTEHWRGPSDAYRIETYQWFTIDGKPSTFHHTLEEREEGKKKLITKEKTYPLDSAGNVVNRYLGRFDDPYIFYNYNRRFDMFISAKFNGQGRFKEDHLVRSKVREELFTFSGIKQEVKYELEYEYR